MQFKGSPADLMPQHDTLLFLDNNPVPIANIKHDVLTITIGAAGSQQQNQGDNLDVNNDGFVSPIDALLIVNQMAVVGEGESGSGDDSSSKIYPDVNGDYKVTAVDAMLVLNGLSGMANSGEGEQVVAQNFERDARNSQSTDAVFMDLGSDLLNEVDKIAITDCPLAPEEIASVESVVGQDVRDEEEDNGLLDILAGDVDQVWI